MGEGAAGEDRARRVIYALPFTTIADQTASVFDRAFTEAGADPDDDPLLLAIDHHRHETPTDHLAEQREVSTRAADTILSSWRSRMTVTMAFSNDRHDDCATVRE